MRLRIDHPLCLVAALLATLLPGLLQTAVTAQASESPAERIDELFAEVARSDSPGAAVAVIQDGKFAYRKAFGMADLERGVVLTPESVFEIGSVSKQFTAFSILLLEAEGRLTLDDDVRKWVPELPVYEHPITIRHLLHHTSGLRDIETLLPLAGKRWVNYYSEDENLALITRQRGLNFSPGEQYLYSNSGYLLLARVVERLSGQSLRDFAQKRIFEPLGMKDSQFFDDPGQMIKDRALPYALSEDGQWEQALWNLPFAGPSGLYTTLADLALWDANLYDNQLGGGSPLMEKMTTPGVLTSGDSIEYAAGLVLDRHRHHEVIGHDGAWMGYRAEMIRLPEQRLTVILLANAAGNFVELGTIADLFLEAKTLDEAVEEAGEESTTTATTSPSAELSAKQLDTWVGTYWNEAEQLLRKVERRNGKLYYARTRGEPTELGASDEQSFTMIGPSVHVDVAFKAGATPSGRTMTVTVEGDEPLLFAVVEPPGKTALAELSGRYWSSELLRELQLVVENGRLFATWSDEPRKIPVEWIQTDEILVPGFVQIPWFTQDVRLSLERNESGEVVGFVLSCNMVRGVQFERRK